MLLNRQMETVTISPEFPNLLLQTLNSSGSRFETGSELPIAWHWMHFLLSLPTSELFEDGCGAADDLVPHLEGYRRMWAGGKFEVSRCLRVGDPVTRHSRLSSVQEKEGNSGKLVLATVEHDHSVDGAHCFKETQSIVFREASGNLKASAGVRPDKEPMWVKDVTPNEVLLFRYSALTFNAHRIHYDWRYTTEVEGYPGLLVHGPLSCTLLLELLREYLPDRKLAGFSYRAMRPAFVNNPLRVCGTLDISADVVDLWVEDNEGFIVMKANATLKGKGQ